MSTDPFNAPRVVKYNPAFLAEEDLIRSFVVRHVDLELLVEIIADNDGAANQHLMVVGPRGSGKTSLLHRVGVSIKRDTELGARWLPVFFTEESYEVTSAGELWLEALMHLADQAHDEGLQRSYDELHLELDDERLRERALALLLDYADEHALRLILMVENFHMLVDQISDDDAWKIRHTLQTEPRIMLLASATARFDQIQQTGKAFYELFKVHELPPLTVEECGQVWSAVTGEKLRASIRPIHILTGGNLRLLTIISSFAHDRTFSTLLSDLMLLVDEHTAYFKSHLDGLPSLERKVYLSLAEIWAPAMARQVSVAARVDVNRTSSLLNRLVKRGAVVVVGQESRKKIYQLSERLYNVYYLMRRRGSPSQRVRAAVSFMLAYYGERSRELADFVAEIAKDACRADVPYRAEHISAYAQLIEHPSMSGVRAQILRATPNSFFEQEDVPEKLRNLARPTVRDLFGQGFESWLASYGEVMSEELRVYFAEIVNLEVEVALGLSRRAVADNGQDGAAWARLGWVLGVSRASADEVEAALLTAMQLKPETGWSSLLLGAWYVSWARAGEAEREIRLVVDHHPDYWGGWLTLGDLLSRQSEREEEALECLRRASPHLPVYRPAWVSLAMASERLEDYETAEHAYRRALSIDGEEPFLWRRFANLLSDSDRPKDHAEAKLAFERALDLDAQDPNTWTDYAVFLFEELDLLDEAQLAFQKVLELGSDQLWTWIHYGDFLAHKGDALEQAEQAYRQALEIEPEYPWAQLQLGTFLSQKCGRLDEAESLFRALIERNEHDELAWAWAELAKIFDARHEPEQASHAYEQATSLKPEIRSWWILWASSLWELVQPEQALNCLERAIELGPADDSVLGWMAYLQTQALERHEEAVETFRCMSSLHPTDPTPHYEMGVIFHEKLGRHDEAAAAFEAALERAPHSGELVLSMLRLAVLERHTWKEALDHTDQLLLLDTRDASAHNEAAWYLYEHGPRSSLDYAEAWARRAAKVDPEDGYPAHTHATILASLDRIDESLQAAEVYLRDQSCVAATIKEGVTLFVELAANGAAAPAAGLLRASPNVQILEAVLVALELEAGTPRPAPKELMEVAQDIREDIRVRRAALAASE